MTSNPLTPTTLPPSIQDSVQRLAQLTARHLLQTESRLAWLVSIEDLETSINAKLTEGITRVIEEAKT